MMALISVVSPIYGCRKCLPALAEAVKKAFEGSKLDWELILVDDRAPDEPWEIIEELSRKNPKIHGVRLSRNHGQHLAIWAGLKAAKGDWVSVIDCDLQDDPAIIPQLHVQSIKDKVDAVIVSRGDWKDTVFRRFTSKVFYKLMKVLAGVQFKSDVGNFGLYSRRMVNVLLSFQEKEIFLPIMIVLTGLPKSEYKINRSDRHKGVSSYSLMRLLKLAVSIIIRFSDRPLKLSIIVGLAFTGFSSVLSIFLVIAWTVGSFSVPGWASLFLSIWFLSGLILAVLGIHGFYIGRIFTEVQNRPRVIVETTTNSDKTY
jgi:glycosyltransferase involved in cell wall biosynthesis